MRKPYILIPPTQLILSEDFPMLLDFAKVIEIIEEKILTKITDDTILSVEFMVLLPEGLCFFRLESLQELAGCSGANIKLFYKSESGLWI